MKATMVPTGEADENGVVPVEMGVAFDIEIEAAGQRREDGLTAAEVEEEMRLSDGS